MSDETKNGSSSNFALTVRRAAQLQATSWPDERIAVIARTIAPPDAGAAEIAMFLAVANRYNLDPFAKEIWLAKDKGRLIILTGKDAILKVARSNPGYGGYEADVVHAKDQFQAVHSKGDIAISHEIDGFERGPIIGAYCLAQKEGHPPVLIMRRWDQYAHLHAKDNWKNYPEDMLLSRVVTAAHRGLYNISGMYTAEELESGEAAETLQSHEVAQRTKSRLEELKSELNGRGEKPEQSDPNEIVQEAPAETSPVEDGAKDQSVRGRFWALYKEKGYDADVIDQEDARKAWMQEHFSKSSFRHLTTAEIRDAIDLLEAGKGPARPGVEVGATQHDDDLPF